MIHLITQWLVKVLVKMLGLNLQESVEMQIYLQGRFMDFCVKYLIMNIYIFCCSTNSVISHGSSGNANLCNSTGSTGVESCAFNSPASTFYIRVLAFESHSSGNLEITGSNLLSESVTGSLDQTTTASTTLGTSKFTFTIIKIT